MQIMKSTTLLAALTLAVCLAGCTQPKPDGFKKEKVARRTVPVKAVAILAVDEPSDLTYAGAGSAVTASLRDDLQKRQLYTDSFTDNSHMLYGKLQTAWDRGTKVVSLSLELRNSAGQIVSEAKSQWPGNAGDLLGNPPNREVRKLTGDALEKLLKDVPKR